MIRSSELRASYTADKRVSDYNHSLWAYYVLRPLAFVTAPLFLAMGLSATSVTLLGATILVVGLLAIAFGGSLGWALLGAFLINTFHLLDFVDGIIARWRRTVSLFGEMLDFFAGILFHVAMPLAVASYLARSTEAPGALSRAAGVSGAELWWVAAVSMSGAFLLRRVVTQKMQLTFEAGSRPASRRGLVEVGLRTVEALKPATLLVAIAASWSQFWLLGYAGYAVVTLVGLVYMGARRARRVDADRTVDSGARAPTL